MGTVMEAAAPVLGGGSAVGSIASGFMQGAGTQAADDYQAQKLRVAAEYAKTAAVQTDAQMRENMNVQLENIDAVRAAANTNPTSPTTAAIRDRTEAIGDRARTIQVGNIMAQAAQNEADARYYDAAGKFGYAMGVAGGFTNAAGKLAATKWG